MKQQPELTIGGNSNAKGLPAILALVVTELTKYGFRAWVVYQAALSTPVLPIVEKLLR
jgi:hypothetical protein